jgi:myo-inositol 2-dehydrogenase/D-chiro-inositol 1-dehydrogenase
MYVTWTAGHGNFRLDVYGNDGHVGVDLVKSQALEVHLTPRDGEPDGWLYPDLVWDYGYAGEQQYFVDRILGRVDGSLAATAEEARAALALMLAAQESLDTRAIVELP